MEVRRFIIIVLFAFSAFLIGFFGIVVCAAIRIESARSNPAPELPYETIKRTEDLTKRIEGISEDEVEITTRLIQGTGVPSDITAMWPCFRGEKLDGIAHDSVPLLDSFLPGGPPILWSLDLGDGYAGAAVRHGRVYILDYDLTERRDTLRCLSLDDGKEIWNFSYPVKVKRNHGMSRTIPYVTDKYCVTLGPKCHLACVDAITGEGVWFIDMVKQYGTVVPGWYAGQCPLVVEEDGKEILILAPSGTETIICAIDLASGEEIWACPNTFGWQMTHVSVVPMDVDGRRTYVYCGNDGIVACDGKTGEMLWSSTDWSIQAATCASPVVLPDNRIFFCGGYNSNAAMIQVVRKPDGGYEGNTLFKIRPAIFGSTQQTPIFYQGHLFGLRERGGGELVCLDLEGKVVWQSGSGAKFGLGPYMIADGKILVLDDFGKLTIAEATIEGYKPYDSYAFFEDGHEAWAPMSLVDGRLIIRDLTKMHCIDLRK